MTMSQQQCVYVIELLFAATSYICIKIYGIFNYKTQRDMSQQVIALTT